VNRNVEIKARLDEPERTRELAAKLADTGPERIEQCDTFYPVEQGRLKLRELGDGSAELIWYERPDRGGPGESRYTVVPTEHPARLGEALRRALGERGVVRKRRELFLVGRTRIHLDRVDGLGDFLELEVVLENGEGRERGEEIARSLMRELEIQPDQLVDVAYVDLQESACAPSTT
jgi:adenylate cyclase class IV